MGKQFFQSFDCIVKPAGFERYSHGYIRIVNDVMQGFELYRSSTGRTATLRFDIIPICSSFSNFSDIGFETYSVCQLIDRIDPGEPYTPRERSEIDKCIIQLKNKYVSWLHPLFQKTESCESAFPNILEIERRICGKDTLRPNANIMYMALKAKNWGYASQQIQLLLSQRKIALSARAAAIGLLPTPVELQVNEQLEALLAMIDDENYKDIEAHIRNNEIHNRNAIKEKFIRFGDRRMQR